MAKHKPLLALVRHGQSEWNALGKWTGHTDVGLSEYGKQQARDVAQLLSSIPFDYAYASQLRRTQETLDILLKELKLEDIPVTRHPALNERHYGIYTGKLKEEIKKEIGDDHYFSLRRGWDHPIPEGESLKDVHSRVVKFFNEEIAPHIHEHKNILVVAHGNTIRALAKELEDIGEDEIMHIEIAVGEVWLYELIDGKLAKK